MLFCFVLVRFVFTVSENVSVLVLAVSFSPVARKQQIPYYDRFG